MIQLDQFETIDYPIEVMFLWSKAIEIFLKFQQDIEALVTFGSFVNGDFHYVNIKGQIRILSDFEFTVIAKESKTDAIKKDLLEAVKDYNTCYSLLHFGHNLNIKVNTAAEFYEAIEEFHFFRHTIKKTGKVVFGNSDFLIDPMFAKEDLPVDETRYIYNQRILVLFLHANSQLVKDPKEYPVFAFHLLTNTSLKLLYVLSCYFGLYPNNYRQAISYLEGFVSKSLIKDYKNVLEQKDKNVIPSMSQANKMIRLTSYFFEFTFDVVFAEYKKGIDESTGLKNILDEYLNSLTIDTLESRVEEKKLEIITSFLENKGEHYNFYKNLYN